MKSKTIIITTFFQIWICSIQIDFIAIFRFERFCTSHDYNKGSTDPKKRSKIRWRQKNILAEGPMDENFMLKDIDEIEKYEISLGRYKTD